MLKKYHPREKNRDKIPIKIFTEEKQIPVYEKNNDESKKTNRAGIYNTVTI